MEAVEMTKLIEEILENKKGREIEIINVEGKTVLADYFVIVTGTSTPHVRSLSEEIQFRLKEDHKIEANHVEGSESAKWILLDYGGVIVHIFQESDRDFYSLEKLWQGRKKID